MDGDRQVSEAEGAPGTESSVTRRTFLRRAGLFSLAAALSPALLGALSGCSSAGTTRAVRMGIVFGNQILWRYLAQKKESLLRPLGYTVSFTEYQDESQLVGDFIEGKIDVCATLANSVPLLTADASARLFAPIAWMKWGFPIVVADSSSLRSISDLQGKKLAYFGQGHPSTIYWQAFIRETYGFDLRQRMDLVEYDQFQGANPAVVLAEGKVDAAVVESHALSTLLPKGSVRQIGDLRAEWGKISKANRLLVYGGYVAKSKWVEANKGFVNDLIRLNYEALKAYKANKASLVEPSTAYSSAVAPPMDGDVSTYVAEYLGYDDVEAERAYLSPADVDDYKTIFSLLAKTGYLGSAPQDTGRFFFLSDKRPK